MQTLPAPEVDCAVDIDSHEHRVLHYLTKRAKGRVLLADYDLNDFAAHTNQADVEDLRWALSRLIDLDLVQRVAGAGEFSLPQVRLLLTCGCKGRRGMYDANQRPPSLDELPDSLRAWVLDGVDCLFKGADDYGNVYEMDPVARTGKRLTPEEVKALSPSQKHGLVDDSPQALTRPVGSEPGAAPPPTAAQRAARSRVVRGEGVAAAAATTGGNTPAPKGPSAAVLVNEFDGLVRTKCFGRSSAPTNRAALSKNIAAWRRNGTSVEDIRGAMRLFTDRVGAEPKTKRYRAPLWQVFAGQIDALVAAHRAGSGSERGESIRHDKEAWGWD